jgi:putative oxidoreductase
VCHARHREETGVKFLAAFEGPAYAGFRILTGLLFMQHGLQKVFGILAEQPAMNAMLWTAGVIELVGGALVAVGFQTRIAAFLASGLMAAAYFMAHAPNGFFPMLNKGELAVLYCWAFLVIATRGPGRVSMDAMINSREG